jgi:hypothetical protein
MDINVHKFERVVNNPVHPMLMAGTCIKRAKVINSFLVGISKQEAETRVIK